MNFTKFNFQKKFKNKKVLVTGHTGCKGSWLTYWLILLGAKVIGLSINIPSKPSHFQAIKLKNKIIHKRVDIRNLKLLKKTFKKNQPDYIFHLAAYNHVGDSFIHVNESIQSNLVSTINILNHGPKYKKFINIASSEIYGLQTKVPFNPKNIPFP